MDNKAALSSMQLQDILYSQGFGTRRICAGLIQHGLVSVYESNFQSIASACVDVAAELDTIGLHFKVQGENWIYKSKAYLMINKPMGTECSQKPSTYPSVYTLLPTPLRLRPTKGIIQGVQAVGRLDQDTTGLLLLSDDGQFIHRMSAPKKHVPKVYEIRVKHLVKNEQVMRLLEGVVLDDDPSIIRAASCIQSGDFSLRLTLMEGKYHQVKRMIAAVGNRVENLHRARIGNLELPTDLSFGSWRWLSDQDMMALLGK